MCEKINLTAFLAIGFRSTLAHSQKRQMYPPIILLLWAIQLLLDAYIQLSGYWLYFLQLQNNKVARKCWPPRLPLLDMFQR